MKNRILPLLLLPVLASAAPGPMAGANTTAHARPGAGPVHRAHGPGAALCRHADDCPLHTLALSAPTSLSPADLVAAVEEERVARDLYVAAAERWSLPVFARIAQAEDRHEAALVQVATVSSIALPVVTRGVYTTSELQRRYVQLLALVNESATAALRAGALVEETDIAELRRLQAVATDPGTQAVLAQLEKASARHLSAFVRGLAREGERYVPQVLSAEEFAALVPQG